MQGTDASQSSDGGSDSPLSWTLQGKSQEIKPQLFDGCEKPQILLLSNSWHT